MSRHEGINGNTRCEVCNQRGGRKNKRGIHLDQDTYQMICKQCGDEDRGAAYFRVKMFSPDEQFPGDTRPRMTTLRIVRADDKLRAACKAIIWARRYDKGAVIYDVLEGLQPGLQADGVRA